MADDSTWPNNSTHFPGPILFLGGGRLSNTLFSEGGELYTPNLKKDIDGKSNHFGAPSAYVLDFRFVASFRR